MAPSRNSTGGGSGSGSGNGASFPCPDCDKVFSRKEYMARHHRSKHSKDKPFVCGYCERGFARSDLLKRHYTTCQEAKAQQAGGGGGDGGGKGSGGLKGGRRSSAATTSSSKDGEPMEDVVESSAAAQLELPIPPASFSSAAAPPPPPPASHGFFPTPANAAAADFSSSSFPMPPSLNLGPNAPNALDPFGTGRQTPTQAGMALPSAGSGSDTSASPDFFGASPAGCSTTSASSVGESPQAGTGGLPLQGQGQAEYPCPPASSLPTFPHNAPSFAHYQPQPSHLPTLHPSLHQQQQHPAPPPPSQQQLHTLPTLSTTTSPPSGPSTNVFTAHSSSSATLAPGLSQTGSFTQDEVLASEVLRDLMRSPQPLNARPGVGGALYPRVFAGATDGSGAGGTGGAGGGGVEPWHGAKAAAKAGGGSGAAKNEAVSLVGGGGGAGAGAYFDLTATSGDGTLSPTTAAYLTSLTQPIDLTQPVSIKLEESPAARQLAEYFNKGGVGGITALELGFPTEPSLFPEFVVNPPREQVFLHTEEDRRFYVPEQKFCLGYLYPWHVPPLRVLSSYARTATEKLLPSIPVLHSATVDMNEMPTHTAFALTVAGGSYEESGQSFANEMLVEKRVFLVRGFQAPEKTFDDRFASLQSLLLYQLLGLFHRDEQQRLLSQSFHSALIYMLRSLDLPGKIKQTNIPAPTMGMEGAELEAAWKEWVKVETWRRVTFIVFLTDLEHSVATSSAQHLSLSDMDLDLPSSDRIWSASSASEWAHRSLSSLVPPPISFLTAIRALMARKSPEPFSEQGMLLAELGRLSSFPLLILSRTLSFLERKTEEALALIDPFKNLLGGLGVVEDREQENRDVLERIRRGREILRKLPGGIARGGGERWFQDVMPTAANFDPSKSSSSASSNSPSSSSSSYTTSPSTATTDSPSVPLVPLDPSTATSLEELLAEFDDNAPYKPFYSSGGAKPGETYEQAQERLRKHHESRVKDAQAEWSWFGPA